MGVIVMCGYCSFTRELKERKSKIIDADRDIVNRNGVFVSISKINLRGKGKIVHVLRTHLPCYDSCIKISVCPVCCNPLKNN